MSAYTTAEFEDAVAPATTPLSDIKPGMPCRQCGGNLIRLALIRKDADGKQLPLESELVCGRCGWPAERELPKQPNLTISSESKIAELQQQLRRLEAENAELRRRLREAEEQSKPTKKHKP